MAFGTVFKYLLLVVFLAIVVYVYSAYNPAEYAIFPRCPFRMITGYKCPGCGSQRAVHELFHANLSMAMHYNILLVISVPYLLLAFVFDIVKNTNPAYLRWRRRIFGKNAIIIILGIIIVYWVLRNTPLIN